MLISVSTVLVKHVFHVAALLITFLGFLVRYCAVACRGGVGVQPLPEIPKVLQNSAKINTIVKTVKNC